MKKMVGKKGESSSTGMVIAIALGVLVLVFGYLFLSGFFTPITEGLETFTPEQIDVKALACSGFVSLGATDSYCKYTELKDAKNTYLNCEEGSINAKLVADGVDLSGIDCGNKTPKMFCEEMKKTAGKDFNKLVTVNGKTCKDWDVEGAKTTGSNLAQPGEPGI